MKKFPTLYKKSRANEKIEQWDIQVDIADSEGLGQTEPHGVIVTTFGELGGKMQITSDTVKAGKNAGKKNATTAVEQAVAEAQSKWEKKLKSGGYCETLEAAQAGETSKLVKGGIEPMLANPWDKMEKKVVWPCLGQPKLDGIRCIAIKDEEGNVTLWTRRREPITSCPHIVEAVKDLPVNNIILDGELYNHDLKEDFEKIASSVRKREPSEHSHLIQYHVYDVVIENMSQIERARFFKQNDITIGTDAIKVVPTVNVEDVEHMQEVFAHFRRKGYEGLILRNKDQKYEYNQRKMIKVKEFEDDEFDIVGVEEGRGKLAGHAIFVLKTKAGNEFKAKLKGSTELLKEYFENHDLWKGKQLTVRFMGYTNKENVPRHPVGVAVRDYE